MSYTIKNGRAQIAKANLRARARALGCSVAEVTMHLAAGHWRCPGRDATNSLPKIPGHWVDTGEKPGQRLSNGAHAACSDCKARRTKTT